MLSTKIVRTVLLCIAVVAFLRFGPGVNWASPRQLQLLTGDWNISRQSRLGSSLENWKITAHGRRINIEAYYESVPGVYLAGDYRKTAKILDFKFNGRKLTLRLTGLNEGVVEKFELELVDANRIEGIYSSKDTLMSNLGTAQGQLGVIDIAGTAILTRKQPLFGN